MLVGAHAYAYTGVVKNGGTQPPSVFSLISNCAPVLCLQLSSTLRFSTLRDQSPGSTSLLSFVSGVAIFPGPLLPKGCGFDLFRPSAGGSPRGKGRTPAAPRKVRQTVLLPEPRDRGRVPAAPEKVRELAQQQPFRDYGKSQHASGTRLHP